MLLLNKKMIRVLLINCLFYTIAGTTDQWSQYSPVIIRDISTISNNHCEWIRKNCGVKIRETTKKRETTFKLYGGRETGDFEYPWAVGLEIRLNLFNFYTKDILGYQHQLCSGSVISNRHILTSQHCFANIATWPDLNITMSELSSETKFKAKIIVGQGNPTVTYRHLTEESARYVPDADYFHDRTRMMHDWALIELAEVIPQELMDSKAVVPICLPDENELIRPMDTVELYGQGGTRPKYEYGEGEGIMRYIDTALLQSDRVYEYPIINMLLFENIISLHGLNVVRPGDSGGGITKSSQVYVNYGTGQRIFKVQCKHVLFGIIHGVKHYNEGDITIAVDVRSITYSVQSLTGIRV